MFAGVGEAVGVGVDVGEEAEVAEGWEGLGCWVGGWGG